MRAAESLVDLGVFTRDERSDGADDSFTLTDFGRSAWDKALTEADQQHSSQWVEISRDGGAESTDAGTDD